MSSLLDLKRFLSLSLNPNLESQTKQKTINLKPMSKLRKPKQLNQVTYKRKVNPDLFRRDLPEKYIIKLSFLIQMKSVK